METVGDRYQPNGAAHGGTSHLKTNVKCNHSMSHMEEGGLGDVFTTRVSARKVRDALRLRSAAQPVLRWTAQPVGGAGRQRSRTRRWRRRWRRRLHGGAGASAPTAAEWDDRGELNYTSLGSSPTHLAVPLIPRHGAMVDGGGGVVDGGDWGCGRGLVGSG